MKYMDCVELIVEKEEYAKYGVHKGMQGIIWLEESIDGTWDVFCGRYPNTTKSIFTKKNGLT